MDRASLRAMTQAFAIASVNSNGMPIALRSKGCLGCEKSPGSQKRTGLVERKPTLDQHTQKRTGLEGKIDQKSEAKGLVKGNMFPKFQWFCGFVCEPQMKDEHVAPSSDLKTPELFIPQVPCGPKQRSKNTGTFHPPSAQLFDG